MKIGLYQFCSTLEAFENLKKIEEAFKESKAQGCEALFLPECFLSMTDGERATPYLVKEGNELYQEIASLCKHYRIALLGGSVAYDERGLIKNRSLNFDQNGELIGFYDKRKLFFCDLPQKKIDEGKVYSAGDGNKDCLISFGGFSIGIGICFDIRFPELARDYRRKGADILSYSSAFTVPTGKAHWKCLVKARAIDTQCYVVATGQWGKHNSKMESYGHSLVVDPWGEVLIDCGEGEVFKTVHLSQAQLKEIRQRMTIL